MKQCPICGKEYPETSSVCTTCGHDPDKTILRAAELEKKLHDRLQTRTNPLVIPDQKEAAERLLETGDLNKEADQIREIRSGEIQFRGTLVLTDQETGTVFRVESDQLEEAVIGRAAISTGFQPMIDLSELGGQTQGVSRRHATIQNRANVLMIMDHTSKNGTYVNEIRVVPGRARVIRNGDIIRIGNISLRVSFELA